MGIFSSSNASDTSARPTTVALRDHPAVLALHADSTLPPAVDFHELDALLEDALADTLDRFGLGTVHVRHTASDVRYMDRNPDEPHRDNPLTDEFIHRTVYALVDQWLVTLTASRSASRTPLRDGEVDTMLFYTYDHVAVGEQLDVSWSSWTLSELSVSLPTMYRLDSLSKVNFYDDESRVQFGDSSVALPTPFAEELVVHLTR